MTPHEEQVAESAAKAAEGFIASLVPETAQVAMVTLVIESADKANLDLNYMTVRFTAAKAALLDAIAQAGYGGQVSDEALSNVVHAILASVHALRTMHATFAAMRDVLR